MSTAVQPDQLEVTRGEQFLALILGIFVAIGLLWGYAKLDEPARPDVDIQFSDPAIIAQSQAQEVVDDARGQLDAANEELEVRREAYRTALDAGRPAADLERSYREAETARTQAQTGLAAAQRNEEATRGPAAAAEKRIRAEQDRAFSRHGWITFLLRLAYVVVLLALSFWLLIRFRRRSSRRLPLLFATVGAATLVAVVMAGDYVTDYVQWQDLGPLVLALVGIALSFAAFVALQRTIVRRIPARRVRKSECPFCGYPVRSNEHCEGCGRDVIGACTSCAAPRRVGTPHCGTCGQT